MIKTKKPIRGFSKEKNRVFKTFDADKVFLYLKCNAVDWEMVTGPKGAMRHLRKIYKLTFLHKEKIWCWGFSIVEDSYNELDRSFLLFNKASL